VTDLERFFRQIVINLSAIDPALLRQPLLLSDLRNSIVPYRANRRALQMETSEDYELALMRLCAGEGGFVHTEPGEAQAEFASELESPNPDLTIVQRHEKALVSLDQNAVAKAIQPGPDLTFAPRQAIPPEEGNARPRRKGSSGPNKAEAPGVQCVRCGGALPGGRLVNFCPHCGQNLARLRCPQCNTELEMGWRHCVACGTPINPK
jgi:hypothetical protein